MLEPIEEITFSINQVATKKKHLVQVAIPAQRPHHLQLGSHSRKNYVYLTKAYDGRFMSPEHNVNIDKEICLNIICLPNWISTQVRHCTKRKMVEKHHQHVLKWINR